MGIACRCKENCAGWRIHAILALIDTSENIRESIHTRSDNGRSTLIRSPVTILLTAAGLYMQEINQYLDPTLRQKSSEWQRLKDLLVLAIPPDMFQRVVYASLEDTRLTIFCESPAWASKMRFYDAEVRKVLSQHGSVVRSVSARSIPPVAPRGG